MKNILEVAKKHKLAIGVTLGITILFLYIHNTNKKNKALDLANINMSNPNDNAYKS